MANDPFAPIEGIALEWYAELSAAMRDTGGDPEKCALVAQRYGVSRESWAAAQAGWTQRMTDPSLMGKVAMAYMPVYQAALGRPAPIAGATYKEYVSMMAALSVFKERGMCDRCGITSPEWKIVNAFWSREVNKPDYKKYADDLAAEKKRLQGGSPPVRWGEDARAPRPDPTKIDLSAPTAPSGGGGAPSSSASSGSFQVGDEVFVTWTDERVYLAQVLTLEGDQVKVQFPNGDTRWVAGSVVEGPR